VPLYFSFENKEQNIVCVICNPGSSLLKLNSMQNSSLPCNKYSFTSLYKLKFSNSAPNIQRLSGYGSQEKKNQHAHKKDGSITFFSQYFLISSKYGQQFELSSNRPFAVPRDLVNHKKW